MNQVEVKRRQIELCSCVIGLINILIFTRILGNNGIAYLIIAMESFAFVRTITTGCLVDTLGKMLRMRIAKGQYKNAMNIRRRVLILEAIVGVVCCIVFVACAGIIAQNLFQTPHSTLIMTVMAPALVIRAVSDVMLGYFQGEGNELPAVVAAPLRQLSLLGFGLFFANSLADYGTKVSNLLGDASYTAMYGGVGIAIAIDLAELIVCIFLGLIVLGSRKAWLKRDKEGMRQTDSLLSTVKILYGSMWMAILFRLFEQLPIWLGTIFYRKSIADSINFAERFGAFAGKFFVLCAIPVLLICAMLLSVNSKTVGALRKEDHRGAKISFQSGLHIGVVHGVFCAIFVMVMAKQLAGIFGGEEAGAVDMFRYGSVLILLVVLFFYFSRLLLRMGKKYHLLGCLGASNILFVIILSILLNGGKTGIISLIYAAIAGVGTGVLVLGFLCCQKLHTGVEWLQIIAIPVGAACVAGLLEMFLANLLTPHLGNLVTTIVCLILSFLVYWVVILLFRSFREQELKYIPGGSIIRAAGQTLRVFDMD